MSYLKKSVLFFLKMEPYYDVVLATSNASNMVWTNSWKSQRSRTLSLDGNVIVSEEETIRLPCAIGCTVQIAGLDGP